MKLFIIAAASAAIVGAGSAYAQNPQSRVKEPEARTPGQPAVGPPQTTDPRTTTGLPRAVQPIRRIPIVCRPALRVDKACLQTDR
jgi:hypothetical protein